MMKTILLAAAALALQALQVFAMESLSEYAWKNRVLIIFGKDGNALVERQTEILKRQENELADRDMVVLRVSENDVRTVYGVAKQIDGRKLLQEADVADDTFSAVLIGKDGGVKIRSNKVVSEVEMFEIIDRMPMRRAEQK